MSTALTMFDQPQLAIPEHLKGFLEDEKNVEDRVTVPSLSYEGKVWTISANGEKTKLMKRDADGDEMPVGVMRVVVLDYAKRRGRAYYEGSYDPSKVSMPQCWSEDGVAPDAAVREPQSSKCDTCPLAAKGSKVTDAGKAVSACSQHRMLAVVPAAKMDMTPLRMKIAVTSDYDKESPELDKEGWFAFSSLLDFLRSKNIGHTAAMVIKMKFDPNVAYPKVKFSPDRWLEKAELETVAPVAKSDEVKKLLAQTFTVNGVDGTRRDEAEEPEAAEPKLSEQAKAKPPTTRTAKPKAEEPKPAPKATVVDDDDYDLNAALGGSTTKAAETKVETKATTEKKTPVETPKVDTAVSDDVASLLAEWGDD
jgi:hypothetical protein